MFQFCTFLGATIVPLSYLIVWDLTKSVQAAAFSALFILFGIYITFITLCSCNEMITITK